MADLDYDDTEGGDVAGTPTIIGYRVLTADDIALINQIKHTGLFLKDLCELVADHLNTQIEDLNADNDEGGIARMELADPLKWFEDGVKDLQTGLMKLTRAVAQPGGF